MAAHFGRKSFAFLEDLEANNDRDRFEANRDRYDRRAHHAIGWTMARAGALIPLIRWPTLI